MKILISGINGFIGRHLSRELVVRGYEVYGIENKSGGVLNKKLVDKSIENADVVVHLAALTSHKEIVNKTTQALETNFLGTVNILNSFLKTKKTKKIIYASTGKVYGEIIKLPIKEDHPTRPLNILGKSKLLTEKLIELYSSIKLDKDQKEFIIFRIFQAYGPNQENFLIPTIISQISSGKRALTLGDIKAKRDYIYIDDLVDAFVRAIERKTEKGLMNLNRGLFIYNICTGVGLSAKDVVRFIEKIKGTKLKIKINKNLLRSDEMRQEFGSFKKAKKELDWQPKVTLEEGLKKILAEEQKNSLQAVILAGGMGKRMQEKYSKTPKILIPISGIPYLDQLITYLKSNGCSDIIICVGYLGEKIKRYVDRKDYGIKIRFTTERSLRGTGGVLNLAKDFIEKDFLLIFGDVYTKLNIGKLATFHKKKGALVTAAIHKSNHPKDSNLVEFDSNRRITKIFKKPHNRIPKNPYNLAALYLISSKIKKHLPTKTHYDFEHDLLQKLIDENAGVYGYNTKELIMDFGTPGRLEKLKKMLHK